MSFFKNASNKDLVNIFRVVAPVEVKAFLYAEDLEITKDRLVVKATTKTFGKSMNFAETDGEVVFIGCSNEAEEKKDVAVQASKSISAEELEEIHDVFGEYPNPRNAHVQMKYKRPTRKKGDKLFLTKK